MTVAGDHTHNQGDAERLARRLSKHWHERGYAIHAWVETITFEKVSKSGESSHTPLFCVRSNLANGMPRPGSEIRQAA